MGAAKDREARPAPRRGSAVKAWFVALLALGGCGTLGWYYVQLMHVYAAQGDALLEANSAAEVCTGQLDPALARADECETTRAGDTKRMDELMAAQKRMEDNLQATSSELESLRKLKVE